MARQDRPTDESPSERQDRLTKDERLNQKGGKAAAPRKRSTGKAAGSTRSAPQAKGKTPARRGRVGARGEEPSHEDIQRRAYEIWEQKGRQGEPEEHWRRAEEELAGGASAAGTGGRNE